MAERDDDTTTIDQRVGVLTATVDQLQAEVNGHEAILALLVGCALATCILMVMLEVKVRRLAK